MKTGLKWFVLDLVDDMAYFVMCLFTDPVRDQPTILDTEYEDWLDAVSKSDPDPRD